jgi:hypothetical protein
MKLPDEYLLTLRLRLRKLKVVEQKLYDRYQETGLKEDADSWLVAQQQKRLTQTGLIGMGSRIFARHRMRKRKTTLTSPTLRKVLSGKT